jgi:hypothetical protein
MHLSTTLHRFAIPQNGDCILLVISACYQDFIALRFGERVIVFL